MKSSSGRSGDDRFATSNTPSGEIQLVAPGLRGIRDQSHTDSSADIGPQTTPPRSVVASLAITTGAGGLRKSHENSGHRVRSIKSSS
eukprot:4158000-Amphidinium_carterae.2